MIQRYFLNYVQIKTGSNELDQLHVDIRVRQISVVDSCLMFPLFYYKISSLRVEGFLHKKMILKGHSHGDFTVCCSKLLKYLTKNLF